MADERQQRTGGRGIAESELYAACREMRDALAAACRVVAEHGGEELNRVFHAEMARAGVRPGVGSRADAAIAKAEKAASPADET